MALIQNTGQTSDGSVVPIPVGGLVVSTQTPLAANGVFATPIVKYRGNESIHFSVSTDQIGSYVIEYFKDGSKISFSPGAVTFDPSVVSMFQSALAGKGDSFRITYTNGSVAQGTFYLEVRFSDGAQQTFRSLGSPAAPTNMAGTTHAVVEARTNGSGNYNQVTGTFSGSKYAQDVYIVNPTTAPTTQPVSGTVSVSNQPTSYESLGVGGVTDAMQLDATKSGSVIALLKGLLQESIPAGTTGTFTAISLAANVQQTIAANANRKQLIISSTSGTILVAVGFTATANNWSYRIVTNGTVEIDEYVAPVSVSLFSTSASTVNVTQII